MVGATPKLLRLVLQALVQALQHQLALEDLEAVSEVGSVVAIVVALEEVSEAAIEEAMVVEEVV